ncbi:DUF418 domain-containing protein [Cellulomonas sp. JZ18]|uniref:DUF418 domain-containing protein n=1 Tax=Cellulomonas sp. JZ18 TaxID=2654191 RepID=UPI0012D4047F|nr:DUF418 domain-containing protein [Cellulomonas sp. JZ18]QGQ19726.1 DUF418 domain-containing protein [Cellulomonas sp. JZ18]
MALAERDLAVDVARGGALLGIALANVVAHVGAAAVGLGLYPDPASVTALDRLAAAVVVLTVDRTTLPVFALLLGWGLARVVATMRARHAPDAEVRRHVRRRCAALAALGVAHGVLLFDGDVLLLLGLTLLVALALVRASPRVLVWTGVTTWLAGALLLGGLDALLLADASAGAAAPATSGGEALAERAASFAASALVAPVHLTTVLPAALLGVWWARTGRLDSATPVGPARTRVVALVLALAAGAPMAAAVGGLWSPGPVGALVASSAQLLAAPVAAGTSVLLVVAAVRAGAVPRPAVTAAAALGARSLTVYLAQSALFLVLLTPPTGVLGSVGMAAGVVVGVGVAAATTALAVGLERAGVRGPAEWFLRRVAYGRGRHDRT